jgi:NAD(P)-dependent dehydrogenase (short-subunit alcohol dehydrogenase family)
LITGATDGLGRHLAHKLAEAGDYVIIHGRNAARAQRVKDEIRRPTDVMIADLADLRQVDTLAGDVLKLYPRLDAVINNAGVGFGRTGASRELSADGIELRFAVNYLAGYHLTRKLAPLLATGTVINVASAGQQAIDFNDPMLGRRYSGRRAYAQSKLAQIMFTIDLAQELPEARINALHPATYMNTSMVRQAGIHSLSTVEEGAAATLRLLDILGSGRYYNGTHESRADAQAYDPAARQRLRALSDELIARAL